MAGSYLVEENVEHFGTCEGHVQPVFLKFQGERKERKNLLDQLKRDMNLKRGVTVLGKEMGKQKVFNFTVFSSLDNRKSL